MNKCACCILGLGWWDECQSCLLRFLGQHNVRLRQNFIVLDSPRDIKRLLEESAVGSVVWLGFEHPRYWGGEYLERRSEGWRPVFPKGRTAMTTTEVLRWLASSRSK